MRKIRKSSPPSFLVTLNSQRRNTSVPEEEKPYYSGLTRDQKQAIRAALCAEQYGICAYCMQRIVPEHGKMKIEHWHSQQEHPDEQLDYTNMLGVCMGNMSQPYHNKQHCDTFRGDEDLNFSPADSTRDVSSLFIYKSKGFIESINYRKDSCEDDATTKDIKALNLNCDKLIKERKAALRIFERPNLVPTGNVKFKRDFIKRKIDKFNNPDGGFLEPYCMAIVFLLKKRLARM